MATLDSRIQNLRSRIANHQRQDGISENEQAAADLLTEVGSCLEALSRELQKNAEADRLLITRLETQTQAANVDHRQKIWVLMGIVGAIAALLWRIDPSTEYGQEATSQILEVLMNLLPVALAAFGVTMAVNQHK